MLKDPWLSLLPVLFYSWLCNTDGADGVVGFHCKDDLLWVREFEKLMPFSRLRDTNECPTVENTTWMQPWSVIKRYGSLEKIHRLEKVGKKRQESIFEGLLQSAFWRPIISKFLFRSSTSVFSVASNLEAKPSQRVALLIPVSCTLIICNTNDL